MMWVFFGIGMFDRVNGLSSVIYVIFSVMIVYWIDSPGVLVILMVIPWIVERRRMWAVVKITLPAVVASMRVMHWEIVLAVLKELSD